MSKMIIYFYLLIPLLCLTVDSSSIRGRNNKNELVPLNSRVGSSRAKGNSLKLISNEPFIMRIPLPKESQKKDTKGADKNTKRMNKKRISKLKSLRKKHRFRRDLSKSKPNRDEKSNPIPGGKMESHHDVKNITKNGSNRAEILKVLAHPRRKEIKRTDQLKEVKDSSVKLGLNRNPPKHATPLVKMVYPSTPKHDKNSHKYTYKDLLVDRKRLEQKIDYIKNMFSVNDSTSDETSRVRRRSESDRTANKIAKMFLTLSAVNGLHEKRKSRCRSAGGEEVERVQDVWEKERRDNPSRKSSSSNEERYKVKKWIEFMKKKRSSGKTCPCLASVHGDEGDAFPLEQKLPKGYFLLERKGSSEESSETYKDPYSNSRDPLTANPKRRYGKDQDTKLKEESKNGKKKLSLPLTDLELYRSRAKQILQNAEEILDRIKEEEERRLSTPTILMNQLKELTSRIHGDPRNNENDLIRKIQKNLGWNPLSKATDTSDGNTFVDNVKSYILDPYEKAKALTDESTKMLSGYLLRNLGKIQESSEEQDARAGENETDDTEMELEKPLVSSSNKQDRDPLARNKEELEQWEDTISTILQGPEENLQKEAEFAMKQENIKNRMQDIIKEQQKKLNDYEVENESEETKKEIEDPIIQSTKEISESSEIPTHTETLQISPDTQHNPQEISENQKETAKDVAEMETPDTEQFREEKEKSNSKTPETFDEITQKENVNLEDSQAEDSNSEIPDVGTYDREETDVLKSPHDLADDYQLLEDEYEAGNDENLKEPLKVNFEEGFTEPRETEETLIEKLKEIETELEQEQSELENEAQTLKALDPPKHNEETENLKETFKDPSMHNQDTNQTETQEAEKLPEYADLVKETSQGSTETHADPPKTGNKPTDEQLLIQKTKSSEDPQESDGVEENLRSQHENPEEVTRENAQERALKSEENLEEPKADILKSALGDQETNEKPAEKSAYDEERETEIEETPLRATHAEKKESLENFTDETLKENLEMRNEESYEATLKSENPVEEIDNQSSEHRITDGKDEPVLDSLATPLREALDARRTDQEELDMNVEAVPKGVMLAENDEIQETRREGSDEMPLQEILNEERDLEKETVVAEAENPIQDIEDKETQNSYEKPDDTLPKNNANEETILKSENPEEDPDNQLNQTYDDETSSEVGLSAPSNENQQTDDEALLKAANSKENMGEQSENENEKHDSEENLRAENPEAEASEETPVRSTWDAQSQENTQDEAPLMKENPDEEAKSRENSNEPTSNEASNEFIENLNFGNDENDEASLKSANPDADNQNSNEKTIDETLKSALSQENNEEIETVKARPDNDQNELENDETPPQATLENQNEENIQATNNEDQLTIIDPNSSEQPLNQETEMLESAKSTPDEQTNQQETVEREFQSLENQKDQSFEADDSESNPMEKSEDLENEILESSVDEKSNQQGTEGSDETPLGATLENEDERTSEEEPYVKESNPTENLKSDEPPVGAEEEVMRGDESTRQYQNETTAGKSLDGADEVDEIVRSNLEEDEIPLRSTNYGNDSAEADETSLQSANPLEQKNLETKEDETPLTSANMEDFDNKLDETSLMQSSNPNDPESGLEDSKETLRSEPTDDFDNQIDEETPLRSSHDTETAETFDNSFVALRQELPLGENLIAEDDNDQTSLESHDQPPQDVLQVPDPTTKSLKPNRLKLPKSIGKIMREIGEEKSDITSIDNLNPEKIDDIIDKIDEAEHQQNLLETHEVDCRKECACADDIDTRSKNLGRYEIVKDFLHWMKDLQLNRVLSDD